MAVAEEMVLKAVGNVESMFNMVSNMWNKILVFVKY